MLERESLSLFSEAARKLDSGFATLPEFQSESPGMSRLAEVLGATAERLQDNFPYFQPLYAGQMLKPPHPAARLAYALAMWIGGVRRAGPDGYECAGEADGARRRGDRCRDNGHHGNGFSRSTAGDSRVAYKAWVQDPCRCSLRRIFRAVGKPRGRGNAGFCADWRSRLDCD